MAKISLRAYLHEIENMIDRGELEQAQANCRQILNVYPKNIDTYRFLGKSYLEGQKYKEAEDIFQRVLSVIPDDFISQVGLSIINEEAGKLDAAIWHMERAYEVQPSNIPIMNEVKRLYGRRDGVEPSKVRLTRGALVRMYARTKLVPQAIAETRAALEEDPNRVDLELILARMYLLSGQKVEASEICTKIISRLPYCLEANRILAEILPETSRADEAKNVNERVNSLDPYAAYVSQNAPTSDLVPDNTIMLEHLSEGSNVPSSPFTEVTDISSNITSQPDWLNSEGSESTSPAAPFSVPISESPVASRDDQVPDWMKEVGWSQSDHSETTPPPLPFEQKDENANTPVEDAVPADVPDWLKDLQAQNTPTEDLVTENKNTEEIPVHEEPPVEPKIQPEPQIPADVPDWLELDKTQSEPIVPIVIKEKTEEVIAQGSEEVPAEAITPDADAIENADVPEWLKELNPEAAQNINQPEQAASTPPPFPENDLPLSPNSEVPSTASAADEPAEIAPEIDHSMPEIPQDWMEDAGIASTGKTGPLIPAADIPEWLKEIEINPEGEESLKVTPDSDSEPISGDMPEWLKDLQATPPPTEASDFESTVTKAEEPTHSATETPDLASPLQAEATPGVPVPADNTDLQQWLSSLETEAGETTAEADQDLQSKLPEEPVESQPPIEIDQRFAEPSVNPSIQKVPTTPLQPLPIKEGILDFESAKSFLQGNDLEHGALIIQKLIRSGQLVDEIISELKTYSGQNSNDPMFWQLLGDAYAKRNQLREALDSYNKAEDLLK